MSEPKRIRIEDCEMARKSEIFANLKPDTEHDVIDKPADVRDHKDDLPGVWVMGVATPVLVLEHEYKEI